MHPEAPNRLYASCGDGFMGGPDQKLILRVITMETAGSHVVQDLNIIIYTAWQLIQLIVIRFSFLPRQVPISLIIVSHMSLIFIETKDTPFQQVQQGLPSAIGTVISMFATNEAEPHTFYVK